MIPISTPEVLELSSDDEDNHMGENYDWISDFFSDVEKDDDSDEVVVVGENFACKVSNGNEKGLKRKSDDDNDDDDECVVLDGDPDKLVKVVNESYSGSDDLLVVGEKGPIACRDFPHPRHDCAKFPFSSTPHEKYCDQCHCFVCDSLAPCAFWGAGSHSGDHCHATDKEVYWKNERKSIKQGKAATHRVHKFPDASLSISLPQPTQIPLLTPLQPNPVLSNQVSRSTLIRPCSSTNFGQPNIINRGRNQWTRNSVGRNHFNPALISKELLHTHNSIMGRDKRQRVDILGSRDYTKPAIVRRAVYGGGSSISNHPGSGSAYNSNQHSINHQTVSSNSSQLMWLESCLFDLDNQQNSMQPGMSDIHTNSFQPIPPQNNQSIPQQCHQSQNVPDPVLGGFNSNAVESTVQSNGQPPVEVPPQQSAVPAYEPSVVPVPQIDSHLPGSIDPVPLVFDVERWLMDDQPLPEASGPLDSPQIAPVDASMLYFDFDISFDSLTHV